MTQPHVSVLAGPAEKVVETLRQELKRMESIRRQQARVKGEEIELRISSGCIALDELLPAGGFARGSLVEWLGERGGGAGTLALVAAREAARCTGTVVVVDRQQHFYPPAAAAWGLDLSRLMIVRPTRMQEELWAVEQSLRCPAVAAVWAEVERLDTRWFRRWQLAAEEGGALGLLLRPLRTRGQPSWADVQLVVAPCPRRWERDSEEEENWRLRVEVARCRGALAGSVVELEVEATSGSIREACEHETHGLSLAPSLAHSTVDRHEARA
jgi:hypothetical protein